MNERRSSPRIRSFLKGRIIYNHGQSSMDCLIRDLSGTGARLCVTEAVPVPSQFDLFVPQKNATYVVAMHWRRGDEIGVSFVNDEAKMLSLADAARAVPADVARRLDELELQAAQLRGLLAQMRSEIETLKEGKPAAGAA